MFSVETRKEAINNKTLVKYRFHDFANIDIPTTLLESYLMVVLFYNLFEHE